MRYSNIDFNVVYVDPTLESSGDGTTPATALNTLPDANSFADNTCYLIRRTTEDKACIISTGSNASVKNIMFLGMPTVSDKMYEFVPDEAKTAWDGDEAMYANIQSTSYNGRLQFSNIEQFVLHRVYLFRDNINADAYIFYLYTRTESKACVQIEHCKFGSKGIDLDQDSYTGEPITNSRLKAYFYVYYARMFILRDCIINHTVTGNTNDAHGIFCYYADILDVEDIKVYSPMYYTSYDYRSLMLSETEREGIECTIRNVSQKIFFNGTYEYVPVLLSAYGYLNARISSINVELSGALGNTRPSNLRLCCKMIYLYYLRDFTIKDITVSLPDLWKLDSGGRCVSIEDCYAANYVPGVEKEVSGITVTLASEDGIGNANTFDEAKESSESYSAVCLDFSREDTSCSWKMPQVSGLVVTNPRGKALYCYNARITDTTLDGTATFRCTLADITKLTSYYPGNLIYAEDGSHIRIHELEANLEHELIGNGYPAITSSFSNRSNIFIDKSNIALRPLTTLNSNDYYIYQGTACNNEGADGHFVQVVPNGVCDTWNVHREGGGNACLKLWNNTYDTMRTMVLGRKPFQGILLTPAETGRHIFKLHVAWKGYTSDSEIYRRFLVSLGINDTDTGERSLWSSSDGRWADDSDAVWANDSELTQKVLEIPFDILKPAPIDVRFYFSWYSGSGFLYVDPAVELVKVAE